MFVETVADGIVYSHVDGINDDIGDNWVELFGSAGTPNSDLLTIDVSNLTGPATAIGIQIGATRFDAYHTSVTVPAPVALLLGSMGVSLVGWLRRRKRI